MLFYIQCDPPCLHITKVKSPDKKTVVEDLLPLYTEHLENVHPEVIMSEFQLKDYIEDNVNEEKPQKVYPLLYT